MRYFSTLDNPSEVSAYMLDEYNISNYENTEVHSLCETQAGDGEITVARVAR